MDRRSAIAGALLCLAFGASAAHAYCGKPANLSDGWTLSTPQAQGIDADALCAAVASVATPQANIHSVLVARGGQLTAEWYFAGKDHPHASVFATHTTFGPAELHDLRSISKSVVALLIGIAQAEKKFPALDTPVLQLFPEHADLATPARRAITLAHLLTMTTGQEWDESGSYANPLANSETRMSLAGDPVRYVLERPLTEPPGTRFNYNGGTTAVLAAVLERSTGTALLPYARAKLFEPLGIRDAQWRTDRRGIAVAYAGLRLRPRDLAKIGVLVLQQGQWQGKQVVPAAWLGEIQQPRVPAVMGMRYGYHWWSRTLPHHGTDLAVTMALGNGGQRLFVVPALDLAVVITAGRYNDRGVQKEAIALLDAIVSATGAGAAKTGALSR